MTTKNETSTLIEVRETKLLSLEHRCAELEAENAELKELIVRMEATPRPLDAWANKPRAPATKQERPDHYKLKVWATDESGKRIVVTLECFDLIEATSSEFNMGNVWKYLFRLGRKGGYYHDLRKALVYLQREVEEYAKDMAMEEALRGKLGKLKEALKTACKGCGAVEGQEHYKDCMVHPAEKSAKLTENTRIFRCRSCGTPKGSRHKGACEHDGTAPHQKPEIWVQGELESTMKDRIYGPGAKLP